MKNKIQFLFLLFPITLQANMLKDMALMMGAQMGASEANKDITKEFQDTSTAIQAEQAILNTTTNNFFKMISAAQKNQMSNINNIFKAAGTQVTNTANQQQIAAQDAQAYIQSVTSLQAPAINYLDNPILYDQLFTNGTMYTPAGQVWKNVFQVGDWEFDFDGKMQNFWQYKLVPFVSATTQIKDSFKNFIFTEWNTNKPYEIICDITLYKTSYPFYVGIIFNKTRWISGDTYGLQKYRTLGIYGDASKKISLCFAQQNVPLPSKNNTTSANPITPLDQIYQNKAIQNFTINQNAFTNLETAPITFHVKIKPSKDYILYKIWGNDIPEPNQYTTITTTNTTSSTNLITTSNPSGKTVTYLAANYNDIYLYHGIGFMAPGAIAQFTLKGPNNLLFTQQNLNTYQEEISNYFNDQQYKFRSEQLLKSTARGAKNV